MRGSPGAHHQTESRSEEMHFSLSQGTHSALSGPGGGKGGGRGGAEVEGDVRWNIC